MLFDGFYLVQGKKKVCLYLQQTDNIFAVNPYIFCQQIDKKTTQW